MMRDTLNSRTNSIRERLVNSRKLGLTLIVFGFVIIGVDTYIVSTFPWHMLQQIQSGAYTWNLPSNSLFRPLFEIISHLGFTLIILITTLFIIGVCLIITGYLIERIPESMYVQRPEISFPSQIQKDEEVKITTQTNEEVKSATQITSDDSVEWVENMISKYIFKKNIENTCPNCGSKLSSESNVCPICGRKIEYKDTEKREEQL